MSGRFDIARADRVNRLSGPSSLPDVAGVVVNRDGGDALFAAIRSLEAQREVDLSIVVVDNASQPSERERLAREAPEARVIAFSRNLGFAGAANEGIARTRSPFLLLVNNDAVLAPDYVARLAARLGLDDRLAAVQGLVLTADGARVDSAGLAWNRRGEAVPVLSGAPAQARLRPRSRCPAFRRRRRSTAGRRSKTSRRRVQVFDSAFFAYYEDVDLSLRLARAGWRFACDPSAVALHEGALTGGRTPWRRAFWTARNRWRTLFNNFDPGLLRRSLGRLLWADLAHARRLGWKGLGLPLLVWPALPLWALRSRGQRRRLSSWPGLP